MSQINATHTPPKTKVKICGNTNREDALMAIEAGADALGFIFVPESGRFIDPKIAADIISQLPPFITIVGVFANAEQQHIESVANQCHLDMIQLHGDESPDLCHSLSRRVIKVLTLEDESRLSLLSRYQVSAYMLDTKIVKNNAKRENRIKQSPGHVDPELAAKAQSQHGRIILAGGLTSNNVAAAVEKVRPYGIDVVSGVEKEVGYKDPAKVRAFIRAVREVEA